ncbi:MAG: pyruvate dehydrogenase (acetyl-transferring) E1 component subunit alpha [Deltaproteobacteria bacterium]|nr:pyruvate dehydrogenase (acetyl-transferring) E1 component subunit alpha [Deltaproteobacteria bacterium]
MADEIIERFEVRYLQAVDESGNADPILIASVSDEEIKRSFESIILTRTFNQRALSLQREGRIGTYASVFGQEASQVGSALALEKDDWVFPSFRETGVFLTMGYPIWQMFRYWAGDERGMKIPPGLNILPMSVPVGTQIPHAAGAAWAMKIKGRRAAAVCYFGDGGSSRGDFHEGLNMAGVFNLPAVFICQNNQWAISVPRRSQSAAKTIAQRAFSYGFDGVQVDGNDAVGVYVATKAALEKAKNKGGPTLIECFTYRLDDHTTSDDASRYRSKEEVEEWKGREPLIRLRLLMRKMGLWTGEYEKAAIEKARALVDRAIEEEEAYPPPKPEDIILYTNAELTPRQFKELKEFGWRK